MTTPARYQIELANRISRINGRVCAVGNAWIITRRPDGFSGELARFPTREEAEAWIARRVQHCDVLQPAEPVVSKGTSREA